MSEIRKSLYMSVEDIITVLTDEEQKKSEQSHVEGSVESTLHPHDSTT